MTDAPARRRMLDTNLASEIIRGPSAAVRHRLLRTRDIAISVITEAEIRFGLAKKPDATGLWRSAEAFLLNVEVLAWTRSAARAYGEMRARLESGGTPLGALDMLIGAHAIAENAILVTRDKALARTPGLTIEDWLEV